MSPYLGELAALVTSLGFSITSTLFTLAGRSVGSVVVNRSRLVLAVLFLVITHILVLGTPFPAEATIERWFWLGLSGVLGLALGDAFLFQAFVWIGPRLSMLMMSLAPVIAAILAWMFLSETMTGGQAVGVLFTLAGVAWVVLLRGEGGNDNPGDGKNYLLGLLFAFGGAMGQAVGLITAKIGVAGDYSAVSGTLMRMLAAAAVLWGYTFLRGQAGATIARLKSHQRAILFIFGGAFTGPFLGVTASLFAIQNTQIGIASTLMALPPVFLLPISYYVFKERPGWQAAAGTVVAMGGVGLLFLA